MKLRKRRSAFRLLPSAFETIAVTVLNQQKRRPVRAHRLRDGVRSVLAGERIRVADVSIVIVDDRTIHRLNRRFLSHDEPTDVITFSLNDHGDSLDGEIVVSADTAERAAEEFGWTMADELLLYVIHGALHLAGYDDLASAARRKMRSRERRYLAKFDLQPTYIPAMRNQNLKSRI